MTMKEVINKIKIAKKSLRYLGLFVLVFFTLCFGYYVAEANVNENFNPRVLGITEKYEINNFLPIANNIQSPVHSIQSPLKMKKGDEPILEARASFAFEPGTEYSFIDKNSRQAYPIASITKLMTALVFLDNNPGWESIHEITREDRIEGGRIYAYLGDKIRIRDLFNLSLVASANTATMALVNSTGLTAQEFVDQMNQKAFDLGLNNTSFVDPIGISFLNLSNAREVAFLAREAFKNIDISETTKKNEYLFKTVDGILKKVYSTDMLLEEYPQNGVDLVGGKTGYTEAAGYCFVGKFNDLNGKEVISVVLGEKNIWDRFSETDSIARWAFDSFVW